MADATRQYASNLNCIRQDHVERYRFAATQLRGRVLDAACGCGYGSRILHDSGCDVTGIDIEPAAIDYAEKHWKGPKYAVVDLNTQMPHQAFDAVVSFETLEHLTSAPQVVKGFWKIAPMLICSVPNELLYPFNGERFKGDGYPHQRHYTPREFCDLLEVAGWSIETRNCQESKSSPVIPGINGLFLIYVCKRD